MLTTALEQWHSDIAIVLRGSNVQVERLPTNGAHWPPPWNALVERHATIGFGQASNIRLADGRGSGSSNITID